MQRVQTLISVVEFRKLLLDLKDKRPDICVRYRLLGEMWNASFFSVNAVTEKGVFLNDENSRRIVAVYDLTNIMQFEIDRAFQGFQPYYHYEVQPLTTFAAMA